MRIYLVGYMYSGKTTVGRLLAQRLGYDFVDTDQLFENKYRTTIPLFLKKYDEPLFRKLEAQVLRSTETMDHVVVATGGGTPCHHGSMEWILQHGVAVHLQLDLEGALLRHAQSRNVRPLLAQMDEKECREYVSRQLSQRDPYYTLAPISIDALNPDVEALAAAVKAQL